MSVPVTTLGPSSYVHWTRRLPPDVPTRMPSASAIALSGMSAAQTALQASAQNIANLNTDGFRRQQVQQSSMPGGGVSASLSRTTEAGPSIETDLVALLQSKNSFLASLAVFRAGDRMMGSLLDAAG